MTLAPHALLSAHGLLGYFSVYFLPSSTSCFPFVNHLSTLTPTWHSFWRFQVSNFPLISKSQLLILSLVGKAWEKWVPDKQFTLFGTRHSLNPGPFNKKEHMLIAIMANTAKSLPYTQYIVWTQILPQYFNQPYARSFGYQILIGLSTNFIGYGLAGLTRRFLVYPSFCVWPASLVTIALNSALHDEKNISVPGPFKRIFRMSRYKFFLLAFSAMFVYFWFPNYIFECLTYFSWMTWISPNNHNLEILTGFQNGLGVSSPTIFQP